MRTKEELIREHLKDALAIMDERGKRNLGDNSRLLWKKEWKELRRLIYISWQLTEERADGSMNFSFLRFRQYP